MNIPQLFIHSSTEGHLAFVNNTPLMCGYMYSFEYLFSVLLGVYLGVELLGHMVTMLNFLRNYQTVIQSSCTILPFHQQYVRFPIFPHLHKHLLFLFFLLSPFWLV